MSEPVRPGRPRSFNKDEAEKTRKASYAALSSGKKLKDLSVDQLLVLYADVSNELGARDLGGARIPRGQLQSASRRLLSRE